ncbi:pesticin C-terminus-like muramidase [Vibrio salilacus]|uniref:pesticin C-terminus-like muramidase n=1 Tax=Vibrio salilacus TaxID=1323749 RepID=UPI000C2B1DAD|nr:pesticin C-terminus-like muramidase [Vibrio salilacus]
MELRPLSITVEELELVNKLVKDAETTKLIKVYNSSSSSVKFECLPQEAQTVIASVAYQYGQVATPACSKPYWISSGLRISECLSKWWKVLHDRKILASWLSKDIKKPDISFLISDFEAF